MSKQVQIIARRPFNRTPQGELCEAGDVFPVEETRADELERLGLAKRSGNSATVADSAVDTQAAPRPLNKAAPKPRAKG